MTHPRNVNRCTPCLEGEHRRCTGSAGNVGCGCIHAAPVPQYVVLDDEPAPALPVHLVAGGTPAALAPRERLDDPEFRAELEASVRRFVEQLGQAIRPAMEHVLRQAEALGRWAEQARQVLVEAGVLDEEPPTDPRTRALWLRRHRGTGPDRQLQRQRRPRRVP